MTRASITSLVLYCTCYDTLSSLLPADDLAQALARRCPGARLVKARALCTAQGCHEALSAAGLAVGAASLATEVCTAASTVSGQTLPVVVAACSALAKGRQALAQIHALTAGQTGQIELADLREGCVWCAAAKEPCQAVLDKAVDSLAMALARCAHRAEKAPQPVVTAPPPQQCRVAVIGAGPAGLAAAATLVDAGVPVTLVDRRPTTGGLLNQIGRLFPSNTPTSQLLDPLRRESALLEQRLKTTVTAANRQDAGFTLTLKTGADAEILHVDAVILATGGQPVLPQARYRAKELRGVISQMELETRLTAAEAGKAEDLPEDLVCIQCVAAREPEAPYCSAICCPTTLKNALRLLKLKPEARVTVLHRNMVTPGALPEALYRRAMAAGVRFVRFTADAPPSVDGQEAVNGVSVMVEGSERLTLPASLVVCSTPLRPTPDTAPLARGLGVRLDDMGFVCGREPLFPLEPAVPGVTLCGAARWPVYAAQAEDQGRAAAMKTLMYLAERARALPPTRPDAEPCGDPAKVDAERCSACGRCASACPYGACVVEGGLLRVHSTLCRRCGACAAVCPTGAIGLSELSFGALRAMIREAVGGKAHAAERRSA